MNLGWIPEEERTRDTEAIVDLKDWVEAEMGLTVGRFFHLAYVGVEISNSLIHHYSFKISSEYIGTLPEGDITLLLSICDQCDTFSPGRG